MKAFLIIVTIIIAIMLVWIITSIKDIEKDLMQNHNAIVKYAKSQLYEIGEKLAIEEFNKGNHKKWYMDEFDIEYSTIYSLVEKQIPQRYRNDVDIKHIVRGYINEYSELINENTNYIRRQDVNDYITFVLCETVED